MFFYTKSVQHCTITFSFKYRELLIPAFVPVSFSLYGKATWEYKERRANQKEFELDKFEELYKQYGLMIHKIIHSLHIYKDKYEYYQTGLIALWEANEKFDPEKGVFSAYAYSYVRGRILSQLTNENRNEEKSIFKETDFFEMIEDEQVNEGLAHELLYSYCEDLTENQRKWVKYTCLHMLTVSEIAEVEHVSISAVKKWRKGAKEKIRGKLEIKDS